VWLIVLGVWLAFSLPNSLVILCFEGEGRVYWWDGGGSDDGLEVGWGYWEGIGYGIYEEEKTKGEGKEGMTDGLFLSPSGMTPVGGVENGGGGVDRIMPCFRWSSAGQSAGLSEGYSVHPSLCNDVRVCCRTKGRGVVWCGGLGGGILVSVL
jgi:hypothetical protein